MNSWTVFFEPLPKGFQMNMNSGQAGLWKQWMSMTALDSNQDMSPFGFGICTFAIRVPEMLNSVLLSLLSFQMHVDNADLLGSMLAVDLTNAPREISKNQMMRLWRVIASIFWQPNCAQICSYLWLWLLPSRTAWWNLGSWTTLIKSFGPL